MNTPLNICIVDDEEDILNLVETVIKEISEDLNILRANNADKALEIIAKNKIHTLITDISMPNMNGNDMIAKIYTEQKKIPKNIIIVSAYIDIDDPKASENLYFFQKPIDLEIFKETIKKCIEQ
jgi:YesN/AraC family two-component response regulator